MGRSFAWIALLLGCSATAQAGTLNLRWDDCFGDGGASNRNFACDVNVGSEVLVGSFQLPWALSEVSGNEIVVEVGFPWTPTGALPPWWDFKNAGACRLTSLSANFTPPASAAACVDWSNGQAVGGLAAYTYPATFHFSSALIKAVSAVPLAGLADLTTGQEYFSFRLVINHVKTVGTGSCAGCLLGTCLYFRGFKLTTPDPRNDLFLAPGGYSGSYRDGLTTWQGGAGVITGDGAHCLAATPTRNRTWGEVKAIYR